MNRFTIPLLLFLLLQGFTGRTQTLDWGINLGGHVDEYPENIHKVPGGLILSSSMDGLRKYDPEGNLIWKFNFFSNVHDGFSIGSSAVDEKGNIYVALNTSGNWGTTKVINDFEFLVGLNLVKIDPEGELLWVRHIGGSNGQVRYRDRKVYITGQFLGTININYEKSFESKQYYDCFSWIYRNGSDIFLARFSDIGVLEDAVQHGNNYNDYPVSLEIDAEGSVFVAGVHEEYACVVSSTYLLRYDGNLNQVWEKKITTEEKDEFLLYPTNLFLSENGKLYVVTSGFYGASNEEFEIPNYQELTFNLMEYDPGTGEFLRLNSYPKGSWNENFVPPSPYRNNMYLQDYKGDLIVYTSANSPLSFENKEFVPQPKNENLLLFRVDKKDFTSEYLTHFEAVIPDTYYPGAIDNPGRTFVDGDKLYLTAAFQSSPLQVLGESIPNNSGNNDRDILLAKIDLSELADPAADLDDDKDGVVNYMDECPGTPAGTTVDSHGCSDVQVDSDNDGVVKHKDACPDTRPGVQVNEKGCEILTFEPGNFKISTTSESCANAKDAGIRVEVLDTSYKYLVRVNDGEVSIPFSDVAVLNDLSSGAYRLCITVEGFTNFEKCFEVNINPPVPLSVYSVVNHSGTGVELQLSGAANYTIHHNNKGFNTTQNRVNLVLEKGANTISVTTDRVCQGLYQEIFIAGEIRLYPNPVVDHFVVEGDSFSGRVVVEVFNYEGRLLLTESFEPGVPVKVNAAGLSTGNYLVRVISEAGIKSLKVLKK